MSYGFSISLYCDLCEDGEEFVGEEKIQDVRRIAREQHGWVRKRIKGELKDICSSCATDKPWRNNG